MDLGLKEKIAVVTGGANGIGLAIARGFAAEGARVALVDVHATVEETAAALTGEFGAQAIGLACDVAAFEAIKAAATEVERRLGPVAHVVHAAAIGSGKFGFPFLNLEPRDWDRVLRVNVVGTANVAHAFAPLLIDRRSGTMLFIASVAGQIGSQTDPPYSASKAAVINFAQCAAKDLAPHGVRVNSICPGMVETTLNRAVWEAWRSQEPPERQQSYKDWAGEKIRRLIPLGRWQEPEDIANLAVFLASERARNITGQTLNVDGGFVMHW